MTNFIFKSASRLVKNSPTTLDDLMGFLSTKINYIQAEQRHQRADLHEMKLMINRLLTDKQLQTQVDEYFDSDNDSIEDDSDSK